MTDILEDTLPQEHFVDNGANRDPVAFLQAVEQVEAAIAEAQGETIHMGEAAVRTDIPSSYGEFQAFPEHRVEYPESVVGALGELFSEYNDAVSSLVDQNVEDPTDYQYLRTTGSDGSEESGGFRNLFIQIDMAGLPESFLETADTLDPDVLKEVLRRRIFELDDSLAMYNMMRGIHSTDEEPSPFKQQFDAALDRVREETGRPIAVLAVTEEKYQAIMASELGITDGAVPPTRYVRETIGFDRVFGPKEFKQHLEDNGGESTYLVYARTSDPLSKLKRPDQDTTPPPELLANDKCRAAIRACALTLNVDNPHADPEEVIPLNDTKVALPAMGMGFRVDAPEDLTTEEFARWAAEHGVDPDESTLRAKPIGGVYGAFGAFTGKPNKMAASGSKLGNEIARRGAYLVQPELPAATVHNAGDGRDYAYIDRIFFTTRSDGQVQHVGGFRNFLPVDSGEAKKNNIHGNGSTVWGKIVERPAAA